MLLLLFSFFELLPNFCSPRQTLGDTRLGEVRTTVVHFRLNLDSLDLRINMTTIKKILKSFNHGSDNGQGCKHPSRLVLDATNTIQEALTGVAQVV